jgi:hypothetical protein
MQQERPLTDYQLRHQAELEKKWAAEWRLIESINGLMRARLNENCTHDVDKCEKCGNVPCVLAWLEHVAALEANTALQNN